MDRCTRRSKSAKGNGESDMKCPICGAEVRFTSMSTNHEPVHDWRGNLLGYTRGVPDASMECSNGCEIKVRGTKQYEALCRAIGA
jgi:hypothetical protein